MKINKVPAVPTYAIIHGIGEGRLISRRMRQLLTARGYAEAKPAEADIVLMHSGGVYVLPADGIRAQLFVHMNCTQFMTYSELLAAHRHKVCYDLRKRLANNQLLRWVMAIGANGWYLLNIPRGLRMRKGFMRSDAVLGSLPPGRHVFVCGRIDKLSDPNVLMRYTDGQHTYISLEGGHDDCWRHPEPYVSIVQSLYAGLLAQTDC